MADGSIELVTEIKTEQDALRAVKGVTAFVSEHKSDIEKVPGLLAAVRDLEAAQRVLAENDARRLSPAAVSMGQNELTKHYTMRADEFDPQRGAGPRQYSAGSKVVTEAAGEIRLFGRGYTNADGHEVDYLPGLIDDPSPKSDAQRELQDLWSRRQFVRLAQRTVAPGRVPMTPNHDAKILRAARSLGADVARAFVDSANVGAEWIPDEWIPEVERYVKHGRSVASLFRELRVTRETAFLPTLTGGFIPYIHGEPTGDDPARMQSSSLPTDKRQINVKTLAVRTQIGDNAAEDAMDFMLNEIMEEGAFGLLSGEEDAIINGDTAASHEDTALATWNPDSFYGAAPGGSSIDHRRICLGLRAQAYDRSNTTDRSTFSLATLAADGASLVGSRQSPKDDAIVVNNYILATKLMVLDQVVTREKYGDSAPIVTGELARVFGKPIIPSQFLTKDLASTGLYTGSGATSGLLHVRANRYRRVVRRGVMVAMQRDETRGILNVIWKQRGLPLFCVASSATEKNVHFAFNMS